MEPARHEGCAIAASLVACAVLSPGRVACAHEGGPDPGALRRAAAAAGLGPLGRVPLPEVAELSDFAKPPFDRFIGGPDGALDAEQLAGLATFIGRGNCASCSAGPELTNASVAKAVGPEGSRRSIAWTRPRRSRMASSRWAK